MKVRQNLYIDRELSEALEALAASPGANKSRLVNDALASWLARHGSKEVDDLLKVRLDRMSRQLLVTAPLPEADSAALAIGLERFEKFVGQVGRQLASGRRTLGPTEPLEKGS